MYEEMAVQAVGEVEIVRIRPRGARDSDRRAGESVTGRVYSFWRVADAPMRAIY
jgi:hypothetical protein